MKIKYTSDSPKYKPLYASKSAAGFDVYANETVELQPNEWKGIKTGWHFALPEGYALLSCSRSGKGLKEGLVSHLSPGVIDADYRGECFAVIRNVSDTPKIIKQGDRIAQYLLVKVERADFELTETLDETERGSGGFGSTGN